MNDNLISDPHKQEKYINEYDWDEDELSRNEHIFVSSGSDVYEESLGEFWLYAGK